ncbi:MAG: DUF3108 domain-containing protein [Gallionellaceae bacterium]|nr:MAG: DUF3108 domain-containing protein [Gallionellaceae bacterium]
MSIFLAAPTRRIAMAAALSALLHGLLLWLPEVHLPQHEKQLPPLIAKLEPLAQPSAKIARKKPQPKVRPAAQAQPVVQSVPELPIAASAPVPVSAPEPASAPAIAESAPPPAPVKTEAVPPEPQRPPLPKHARLHFDIYQGQGNFKIGESVHTLEISDGRYLLKADVQTTGLAGLIKSYHMAQTSTGSASAQTLKPEVFSEEITDSSGKQLHRANFDWANNIIRFSGGGETRLRPDAQDILSILYQFSAMQQQTEIVSIHIGTGKRFEEYRFEIAFEEKIETAMGTLQTVHFRKLHDVNEEGLEIWFAQEYRLLPVKMRHIDGTGKITAEAIISDIRVSDE